MHRFFSVQLDVFQGPLDLLVYLIRHQNIDIFKIPIQKITKQFLQVIAYNTPQESSNAQIISELGQYLVMASQLIHIKTQMVWQSLSESDTTDITDDEDPRTEIVKDLLKETWVQEKYTWLNNTENWLQIQFPTILHYQAAEEYGHQTATVSYPAAVLLDTYTKILAQKLHSHKPILRVEKPKLNFQVVLHTWKTWLAQYPTSSWDMFTNTQKPDKPYKILLFIALLEMAKNQHVSLVQMHWQEPIQIILS
jgi:segregation and condensation protein A